EAESGDVAQFYDPTMASPTVRVKETQEPIVGLGYHHEWAPGIHTLFFVTRLDDTFSFTNQAQRALVAFRPDVAVSMPGVTMLSGVQGITIHEHFVGKLEIYSGEHQQIWQQPAHNTILGARVQYGHFHNANLQNLSSLAFI